MFEPCEQALKDAGLNASAIDEVILVGGLHVSQSAGDRRKILWQKTKQSVNPDEAVAVGAAYKGAVLTVK
jgi:molecular chaperone DnaK